VLAAEVSASSPDFGHLQPMVQATKRELQAIGVTETPGVAVADSGYWNEEQMDNVVANEHVQVLIPPDARQARHAAAGVARWALHIDARGTSERLRRRALQTTKGDRRAGVRTDQAQPTNRQLPTTRQIRRTLGVAPDHRHPQPTEAPQAPDSPRSGLKDGPGGHRAAGQHLRPEEHTPQSGPSSPQTSPPPRPPAFARHPPSRALASAAHRGTPAFVGTR
jgi:hypothetical protein